MTRQSISALLLALASVIGVPTTASAQTAPSAAEAAAYTGLHASAHRGNVAQIKALAAAGYATDPRYADKVLALFNGDQINGEQINGEKFSNEKLNGDRLDGAATASAVAEFDQL